MNKSLALRIILLISIAGMLFSGYLSYTELSPGFCQTGECASLLSLPSCVYGFVMYLIVFIIAILGLKSSEKN